MSCQRGGSCGTYLELEQTYTLLSNAVNLANFWSSETWDQERMGWAWPRSSHHCDGGGDSAASVSGGVCFGQEQKEIRNFRTVAEPRKVVLGCMMGTRLFKAGRGGSR